MISLSMNIFFTIKEFSLKIVKENTSFNIVNIVNIVKMSQSKF